MSRESKPPACCAGGFFNRKPASLCAFTALNEQKRPQIRPFWLFFLVSAKIRAFNTGPFYYGHSQRGRRVKIAIVTLDGFNEVDSFVALSILNQVKNEGWLAQITAPSAAVTSMNGVEVTAQQPLSFAQSADVVLFGSGTQTLDHIENAALLDPLRLDPERQLIGSQCSGALFLHRLGFLPSTATTDAKTRPYLQKTGCVVEDRPLIAEGNVVTAGGCLSSQYLAGWVIAKKLGIEKAMSILEHVAPTGQKSVFLKHARDVITPQLAVPARAPLYC
jgi:hypothetical protein